MRFQESLDTSGSSSPKKKKGFRHAFGKAFRKKVGDTRPALTKLPFNSSRISRVNYVFNATTTAILFPDLSSVLGHAIIHSPAL